MYNLLIKKHYLTKIFTLSLPKKKKSNTACYYLCKYFIQNTPYANMNLFLKEISKLFSTILSFYNKNFLFVCSNNVFLYNFVTHNQFNIFTVKNVSIFKKQDLPTIITSVFLYNFIYTKKLIAWFKDKKIFTIGFIDFHNQPNNTDSTLLLEGRFFSSVFFFHFILKKLISYVKN